MGTPSTPAATPPGTASPISPTRLACSTLPSGLLTRSPRLRLTPLCSTLGPAPTATLAWAMLDTLDTLHTLDIGPSTATPTLRMVTSVTKNCQTKNDQTEAQ